MYKALEEEELKKLKYKKFKKIIYTQGITAYLILNFARAVELEPVKLQRCN